MPLTPCIKTGQGQLVSPSQWQPLTGPDTRQWICSKGLLHNGQILRKGPLPLKIAMHTLRGGPELPVIVVWHLREACSFEETDNNSTPRDRSMDPSSTCPLSGVTSNLGLAFCHRVDFANVCRPVLCRTVRSLSRYVYVSNFLCIHIYREEGPCLQTVAVLKLEVAEISLALVEVCSEISASFSIAKKTFASKTQPVLNFEDLRSSQCRPGYLKHLRDGCGETKS